MRIGRIILVLAMINLAFIGVGQLIQPRSIVKAPITSPPDNPRREVLELVSSVPRIQPGKYALGDIAMLDNGDFWAVGYDWENVNRIYLSKDKGQTWKPVQVPAKDYTLQAITFSDAQHGWAVGYNGLMIRTTDGGTTWELLNFLNSPQQRERHPDLHAVHFVDANIGYVAGHRRYSSKISDEVDGDIEIFCTRNGGKNWRRCYYEKVPLTAFQITSNARSTFALLNSRIIRTDNQGATWHEVSTAAKNIRWLAFSADGSGWAVGSRGVFQQSNDGGMTWTPASVSPDLANRDWWGVAFSKNGIGLAVGEEGSLALTMDNGKTWQLPPRTFADHLRAIRLRDSQAVILGSQIAYSVTVSPRQ